MMGFDSPKDDPHLRKVRPNKALAHIDSLPKQGKSVQIFYWMDYSEGERLDFRTNVETKDNLHDLKVTAVNHFSNKLLDRNLPPLAEQNFVLRVGNKEGKPKNDMPVLDPEMNAGNSCFERFTLCSILQDAANKPKLDIVTNITETDLIDTTESAFDKEIEEKM